MFLESMARFTGTIALAVLASNSLAENSTPTDKNDDQVVVTSFERTLILDKHRQVFGKAGQGQRKIFEELSGVSSLSFTKSEYCMLRQQQMGVELDECRDNFTSVHDQLQTTCDTVLPEDTTYEVRRDADGQWSISNIGKRSSVYSMKRVRDDDIVYWQTGYSRLNTGDCRTLFKDSWHDHMAMCKDKFRILALKSENYEMVAGGARCKFDKDLPD